MVAAAGRVGRIGGSPEMAADRGQRVAEGGHGLRVPGGRSNLQRLPGVQTLSEEGSDGEEAKEAGRGPGDGEVAPLALRLDAEVAACLLERDLHAPAADVEAQDLD